MARRPEGAPRSRACTWFDLIPLLQPSGGWAGSRGRASAAPGKFDAITLIHFLAPRTPTMHQRGGLSFGNVLGATRGDAEKNSGYQEEKLRCANRPSEA